MSCSHQCAYCARLDAEQKREWKERFERDWRPLYPNGVPFPLELDPMRMAFRHPGTNHYPTLWVRR